MKETACEHSLCHRRGCPAPRRPRRVGDADRRGKRRARPTALFSSTFSSTACLGRARSPDGYCIRLMDDGEDPPARWTRCRADGFLVTTVAPPDEIWPGLAYVEVRRVQPLSARASWSCICAHPASEHEHLLARSEKDVPMATKKYADMGSSALTAHQSRSPATTLPFHRAFRRAPRRDCHPAFQHHTASGRNAPLRTTSSARIGFSPRI